MRILLDTNVLVSAFSSRGTCHEVLEHCVRRHSLLTSGFILRELRTALVEKAGFLPREAGEIVLLLQDRMETVEPTALPSDVCRDPADVPILGTAVAGRCDYLITGDKDLLELREFRGVAILSPGGFWRLE
jgi:uncharacterized protein